MAQLHCFNRLVKTKNHGGFILPMVLIFIVILSVIGMNIMTASMQERKLLIDENMRTHYLYASINVMREIAAKIKIDEVKCFIEPISQTKLSKLPEDWWHYNACQMESHDSNIYYVLEYLGKDSCATTKQGNLVNASFYRLTTMIKSRLTTKLQAYITYANQRLEACAGETHLVHIGLGNWQIF